MYGAIQFALFPVISPRVARFTVIERPRMFLMLEKNMYTYNEKKRDISYLYIEQVDFH